VDAGFTPLQALQTAITNTAILLGLDGTRGRVGSGYTANFILLHGNPLLEISNTEKIEAVVLNGEFLDRAQLDKMLSDAEVSK
jgi:imidazolonepropionase-like amidohydrolase